MVDVLVLVPITRMVFLLFNDKAQVGNSMKWKAHLRDAKQQEGTNALDHTIIHMDSYSACTVQGQS